MSRVLTDALMLISQVATLSCANGRLADLMSKAMAAQEQKLDRQAEGYAERLCVLGRRMLMAIRASEGRIKRAQRMQLSKVCWILLTGS